MLMSGPRITVLPEHLKRLTDLGWLGLAIRKLPTGGPSEGTDGPLRLNARTKVTQRCA